MAGSKTRISNFLHLAIHDEQLPRLGALAEHYCPEGPNTCLLKLRQFGVVQDTAARYGEYSSADEKQVDPLLRLQARRAIPRKVSDLFSQIPTAGNDASHELRNDHATALAKQKFDWQFSDWFHRTFGNAQYKSGAFLPPRPPKYESAELRTELERLGNEAAAIRESQTQSAAGAGA